MNAIEIPPALEAVILHWAEAKLIEKGARVVWPDEPVAMVTPMAFYLSLEPRISEGTFRSRLRSPACPRFASKRSPATCRLLLLQATPELRAFMAKPTQPGQPL